MTETLSAVLPPDVERLVRIALGRACERGIRLATAESCTGGLLASVLTDVDGMAHVFDRGFVVYSNNAKRDMLGVPQELLDTVGPVSEPVARAMADGALARSDSGMAVAVTGYAGPAGPGEPQGLVHFALARKAGPTMHRVEHFGPVDRGAGRLGCLKVSLELLDLALEH
jgi:nicotinamide-nucleotide amidase